MISSVFYEIVLCLAWPVEGVMTLDRPTKIPYIPSGRVLLYLHLDLTGSRIPRSLESGRLSLLNVYISELCGAMTGHGCDG